MKNEKEGRRFADRNARALRYFVVYRCGGKRNTDDEKASIFADLLLEEAFILALMVYGKRRAVEWVSQSINRLSLDDRMKHYDVDKD